MIQEEGKNVRKVLTTMIEGQIKSEYKSLKDLIGERAYRYLMRGGYLRIWRRTTPHNWFIETKRGDMLWHSEDSRRPNLQLFKKVSDSKHKILKYWGSDSGMSEESHYILIHRKWRK